MVMITVSKPDSNCIANELLRTFIIAKLLQIKSLKTGTFLPEESEARGQKPEDYSGKQ